MFIDLISGFRWMNEIRSSKTHKTLWNKLADTLSKIVCLFLEKNVAINGKALKDNTKQRLIIILKVEFKNKNCKFFMNLTTYLKVNQIPNVLWTVGFTKVQTDSTAEDDIVSTCPPNTTAPDTDDSDFHAVQVRNCKFSNSKNNATKVNKNPE